MGTRKIYGMTMTCNREHTDGDGYARCNACGSKVMLVVSNHFWETDSETFKNGEESPDGTPADVFIGEVSGHWCPTCEILVSLSYNFS